MANKAIAETITSNSSCSASVFNAVIYGSAVNIGAFNSNSEVLFLSSDGLIVTGFEVNSTGNTDPFVWSGASGFTDLGNFGGALNFPTAISSDGSTIVGYSATNFLTMAVTSHSVVTAALGKTTATVGFPGTASNPVGFAAALANPAINTLGLSSLTPFSGTLVGGTSGAHKVYSFIDFVNAGSPNVNITSGMAFIDFVGCRFQSNANSPHSAAPSSSNVLLTGTNITFSYCSFTPLVSKYPRPPNYGLTTTAWPASGAGHNTVTQVGGIGTSATANAVIETDAHTYGVCINSSTAGPVSFSKCDFWGFGNIAIDFNANTSQQMTVDNCWLHDNAAVGTVNNEHLDAIGFLNGGSPNNFPAPKNITINHCTIACMGNNGSGDGLAFQGTSAAGSNFDNIQITNNFLSGYGYTINLSETGAGLFTNSAFTGNTFGTDVQSFWGFVYQDYGSTPKFLDYSPMFSSNGSTWHGNTLSVLPGSTMSASAASDPGVWTAANNGQFALPNSTYSTTDFAVTGSARALSLAITSHSTEVATVSNANAQTGAPWPGQAGNIVGYAGAGFAGSLTTGPTTFTANTTYSNMLFDSGTQPLYINAAGCTFINCYFGASTSATFPNGTSSLFQSGRTTFRYCTFGPSPAQYGSFPPVPPGGQWPTELPTGADGTTGVPFALGNDYGPIGIGPLNTPDVNAVAPGGLSFDHCDIWAMINGINFFQSNATNPLSFTDCWIHDPCQYPSGSHTDMIGDVQSMSSGDYLINFTLTHCTIAGAINTNVLAIQAGSNFILSNLKINYNYITGTGSYLLTDIVDVPTTNYQFIGNVISPYLLPQFGLIYGQHPGLAASLAAWSSAGSGNQWRGNKALPGSYIDGFGDILTVTTSNPYFWPDNSFNATDFNGAF